MCEKLLGNGWSYQLETWWKIFIMRYATRDRLFRSVVQLHQKWKIWWTFSLS